MKLMIQREIVKEKVWRASTVTTAAVLNGTSGSNGVHVMSLAALENKDE